MQPTVIFSARTEHGAGLGKTLGTPTINLRLEDVPSSLRHGVYACRIRLDGSDPMGGALHFGNRPTINAGESCEVHVLDFYSRALPEIVEVEIVAHIRDVRTFADLKALQDQIHLDIREIRQMLDAA